ncbi:hypothetical protein AB0M46_23295 [Dactylosporangium sp. NPDC051485]|uniref:hypothetical protein n=1 Tax=Dactylosporangium sp. NPDC051485 TaxID=3154846 RepID=UPI003420D3B2
MATMTPGSAPAARSRAAGLVRFVAAAVSALTVAAVGAALGAWLGWRNTPALPSDAAVLALVQPAAADARLTVVDRHDAP